MLKPIAQATLVAGTLDILAAIGLTLFYGRAVPDMLRSVASGPFPAATGWGGGGAILGLVVHFALMAIMVALYVGLAPRWPATLLRPLQAGLVYGLVSYIAMNLVVVPLRFGAFPHSARAILTQLFCHIVLVGIPIALITARSLRTRPA